MQISRQNALITIRRAGVQAEVTGAQGADGDDARDARALQRRLLGPQARPHACAAGLRPRRPGRARPRQAQKEKVLRLKPPALGIGMGAAAAEIVEKRFLLRGLPVKRKRKNLYSWLLTSAVA